MTQNPGPIPQFERIKRRIVRQIEAGTLKPGDRVSSENSLVKELGVSRMTVNRAMRELSHEGLLIRVQGTGTFVSEQRPPTELLQLRNIADEIREAGERHSAHLELLEAEPAGADVAHQLEIEPETRVFHSILVHMAGGRPVQVEDRYVNPRAAPDYLDLDFEAVTPNEYLTKVAPLSEVEHIVEAVLPEPRVRALLKMGEGEPCLVLRRRTWTADMVDTWARLFHPGASHRFGTRFAYHPDGKANRSAI